MRVVVSDPAKGTKVAGDRELLPVWQNGPGTLIWADFGDVSDVERTEILEGVFRLHPLAIQDALRARHPPKVERFGQGLFLMLRGFDAKTETTHVGFIDHSLFLGPNFLVTRHTGPSVSIDDAWTRITSGATPFDSPEEVAMMILEGVIDPYLPILHALEPRLEVLEREIFDAPRDELLSELTAHKSSLKQLRRVFTYHTQMLEQLRDHPDLVITSRFSRELNDICEQVARCESLAVLYYELASDLVDAYLATSAHRLNQVMKVLTVITVIFVPLSFLAGIYGMNFENIPELKWSAGYFILLGIMGCIVAAQLTLFRRKRWL